MGKGRNAVAVLKHPSWTLGLGVRVFEDYEQMSRAAARRILLELERKPGLLLCLATGSSPARTYGLLARKHRTAPRLFQQVCVLKLDEWGGLGKEDPGSCEAYLQERVIRPLKVPAERYFGFSNDTVAPEEECERLRQWVAQNGPIDLSVLGLGTNGHLGMNEPARALSPFCHRAKLSAVTRGHGMLAGAKRKPVFGYTLGMAELLQSRQILLLVSGESKRRPLERLLRRELTPAFPASFLWLHPETTVLCDRAAAHGLEL